MRSATKHNTRTANNEVFFILRQEEVRRRRNRLRNGHPEPELRNFLSMVKKHTTISVRAM